MKYEHGIRYRLNNDIHSDVKTSIRFFDSDFKRWSFKQIGGFIQEYKHDPYGSLFLSEMQVNIWKIIQKINPIWYFDATGSMHKRLEEQGPVYLYTFVCHDYIKQIIIPIALFLTTEHTTSSISQYLLNIKAKFLLCSTNNDSFPVAPIVVTDESWAIINAVCNIFNNTSIQSYIKWTYQVLIEFEDNIHIRTVMNTKLFLCHVHFLHNAIKKIRHLNLEKESQDIFIYGFIALQNCQDILSFKSIYKSLFVLFNIENCDADIIEQNKQNIKNSPAFIVNFNEEEHENKKKISIEIDSLYINEDFHGN